jgi:2-phosphosulfolactate phosphatase
MPGLLNVYALPTLVEPEELLGGTAVVIDVLRATTTIVYALAAGAREVIPCAEVEETRQAAGRFPADQVVLGGERQGLSIQGFDLGNSPDDYTPERVGGKTVVMTTTNGTRAMIHARMASQIFLGAFVNATAVCERLQQQQAIHILCAGTDGKYGGDDVLLAGMLADRLQRRDGHGYRLNAQAITAQEMWLHQFALPQALGAETLEPERLAEVLYDTPGGRTLAELGLDEDILAASQIDRFDLVAELDPLTLRIHASVASI